MTDGLGIMSGMKVVYWLPAAALAGFIVGGWGAREDLRDEVSTMNLVDFIDPGVAEPLVRVQGKLEGVSIAPRGGAK